MGKVIYVLIYITLVCYSCNESKKIETNKNNGKKEIKIYNGDSIGNLTESELNGCYLYKLFPNGDTNFIYFLKDHIATSVIAWDTNGIKTLENNKGIWKQYRNSVLTSEAFFDGRPDGFTQIYYFPSGKKSHQLKISHLKLVEIIKFNENGDTIHYERPNQNKSNKKEKELIY